MLKRFAEAKAKQVLLVMALHVTDEKNIQAPPISYPDEFPRIIILNF